MREATLGRLLLEDAVPPALHGHLSNLNAKNIRVLFQRLADEHPDKYKDISHRLSQIASKGGYESGGYSFGPQHLQADPETEQIRQQFRQEVTKALNDNSLSPKMREATLVRIAAEYSNTLQDSVVRNGLAHKNPIALQVESGAKGKAENLKALIAGDTLYTDSYYNPVPYPVVHSFAEGLRPHEFVAGSYGARLAMILTKLGTAKGGWLCLDAATEVRMADGSVKAIKDVRQGDRVCGVSRAGDVRPVTVLAHIATGNKEVFRYRFRPGRSRTELIHVDATRDHKVLLKHKTYLRVNTETGAEQQIQSSVDIRPLSYLDYRPGNHHYSLTATNTFDDSGFQHEPRALLMGLLLGDGCLTYPTKITWACAEADYVEERRQYLQQFGLRADLHQGPGTRIEYTLNSTDNSAKRHSRDSVKFREWLDTFGLLGHKAKTKFIPKEVWRWDNASLAQLITGLFVTDGSFSISKQTSRPVVKFAVTSQAMVATLRELLAVRFGIHSSPSWAMSEESLERFNATSKSRGERLGACPKLSGRTHVIHRNPLHAIIISNREHLRRFAELVKDSKHPRAVKYATAVASMTDSNDDLEYGYTYVDVEPLGIRETFDIEVDHPDHLFLLANGAVVSNSKRLNGLAHRLVVTAPDAKEHDASIVRGFETSVDDPDNDGALLAHPVGGYPRNTVLDRHVIGDLKKQGIQDILIRSPLVGGPINGGVYGRDVGIRERGKVAPVGDFVGLAAAQAACLAEGTMVAMADGTSKAIESVIPGDMILGASRTGEVRPVRVLNRFDNGPKEVYETVFRNGTGRSKAENMLKLRSTLDHKILSVLVKRSNMTQGNRRPAAEVQPVRRPEGYSRFYAKLPTGFDDTGTEDEPYALALGLLIGDGCYTGGVTSNGIAFSCHDRKLIMDVETYLRDICGCYLCPQSTVGEYRVSSVHGAAPVNGGRVTDVRNPMRKKLLDYALWGQRSHTKTLPNTAKWSNKSVAALISGLIATDGYVSFDPNRGAVVGFGSTSESLVRELRRLLAVRFGIYASGVSANYKKRKDGATYRPIFNMAVGGYVNVMRLHQILNIPGVKQERLRKACESWEITNKASESGRCSFVSQTYLGKISTYDLEVDHPDHLFVLENMLVVHNSEPLTQMLICLREGTEVRMADGTVKRIEYIQPGELVMGSDINGYTSPVKVLNRLDQGTQKVYRTAYAVGSDLLHVDATLDHKILSQVLTSRVDFVNQVQPVRDQWDVVIVRDRDVVSAEYAGQSFLGAYRTYDLSVDSESHLFVLANGMVVSNSSKHSGGVAGATGGQQGFPVIDRMFSIPSEFPGGATHAQKDGVVGSITAAPQGGFYIDVGDERHYTPPDQKITVKPGDSIEAGDSLTDGLLNPAEYVPTKGIGEGRRLFVKSFMDVARKSNFIPNRRNIELLARGYIDTVKFDQEHGHYAPGDTASYTTLENQYEPRDGHETHAPEKAVGRYLERPILHYTVGTRVTKAMLPTLQKWGVGAVTTHAESPPFSPVMVRSQDILANDSDWMTRMLGSGLEKSLLKGVHRGAVSDPSGTSYVPALAEGTNFGSKGLTVGWKPEKG